MRLQSFDRQEDAWVAIIAFRLQGKPSVCRTHDASAGPRRMSLRAVPPNRQLCEMQSDAEAPGTSRHAALARLKRLRSDFHSLLAQKREVLASVQEATHFIAQQATDRSHRPHPRLVTHAAVAGFVPSAPRPPSSLETSIVSAFHRQPAKRGERTGPSGPRPMSASWVEDEGRRSWDRGAEGAVPGPFDRIDRALQRRAALRELRVRVGARSPVVEPPRVEASVSERDEGHASDGEVASDAGGPSEGGGGQEEPSVVEVPPRARSVGVQAGEQEEAPDRSEDMAAQAVSYLRARTARAVLGAWAGWARALATARLRAIRREESWGPAAFLWAGADPSWSRLARSQGHTALAREFYRRILLAKALASLRRSALFPTGGALVVSNGSNGGGGSSGSDDGVAAVGVQGQGSTWELRSEAESSARSSELSESSSSTCYDRYQWSVPRVPLSREWLEGLKGAMRAFPKGRGVLRAGGRGEGGCTQGQAGSRARWWKGRFRVLATAAAGARGDDDRGERGGRSGGVGEAWVEKCPSSSEGEGGWGADQRFAAWLRRRRRGAGGGEMVGDSSFGLAILKRT